MQDIDALFVANPFAARKFLKPLLAFGAVASTLLTVVDSVALLWEEGPFCLSHFWVGVQVVLQVVQSPVRFALMRGLHRITGSLDEAAEALTRLTRSWTWVANKQLGAAHAMWSGVCIVILYASSADQCALGRRLMLLHVATFTLRCILTIVWFASTFEMELPNAPQWRAERNMSAAQQLVSELPTLCYRTDSGGAAGARFRLNACVVCLADYKDGEELRVLSCGHYWHAECLGKWLAHRRTCPLCQRWDARRPRDQPAQHQGDVAAAAAAVLPQEDAEGQARRRRHHAVEAVDE